MPLPSPDPYKGEMSNKVDDDDPDLPFRNVGVKWYDSNEDSYCSQCPKDKNILVRGLQ